MIPTLHELEPRLAPSVSPFPEVSAHVYELNGSRTLYTADAPGGPRVVLHENDTEIFSVFVADPESRAGVNPDAIERIITALGAKIESVISIDAYVGTPRVKVFGADLKTLVDFGPTPYAVALTYDGPTESIDFAPLVDKLYIMGYDPQDYYIVQGKYLSTIDPGSKRIDITITNADDLDFVVGAIIAGTQRS